METTDKDPLDNARGQIDQLDQELVRLLAERMKAVRKIGAAKGDNPEEILHDPDREKELFTTWSEAAESQGLSGYFASRVLREILNHSRRDQERFLSGATNGKRVVRVGFQGETGAYSDLAITKLFATRDVEKIDRTGYPTFISLVDALEAGHLDYALLPIENSSTGSVSEANQLIAQRRVAVVDEEIYQVEHCLGGAPGARLEDLREVRSHPVALQQCQHALRELTDCTLEAWSDTAVAGRSVLEANDKSIGAICSEEAAQRLGVQILRTRFTDQPTNQTRFFLVALEAETCDPRQPSKTSLILTVNHQQGALALCLQAFADQGINLSRLESRPQPENPWEYLFFVDIEGHVSDPKVANTLEGLRAYTNQVRVLGTYPDRSVERQRIEMPKAKKGQATKLPEEMAATPAKKAGERVPLALLQEGQGKTIVKVGPVEIGGERFTLIAGPCAGESAEQINTAAELVKARGASIMRGGAFKPRTSPYSFQGLGFPGLDLLADAGHSQELPIVTEVLRPEDAARIAERADMLQVGARNMQNFALLKELGKLNRPVLLKRGMSATVKELLQAAEYIMAGGNHRVVLCERGIRTFENSTRATLDISAVPVLKTKTHLPIIVDPSHAAGVRHLVIPLALAAAAAGADGLIVEMHPRPEEALCDKDQALRPEDLEHLVQMLEPIVTSQGRSL